MEYIGMSYLCEVSLSAPPDTKWDNVTSNAGGTMDVLCKAIEWPRTQQWAFEVLGLQPPMGCCSTASQGVQRQCW
jgi:hypothetical protein